MASPFAVFRRNQKVMLATVGLAAIIAFVFLTPLMSYMGGGPRQINPVVVETNFGKLTRNDLDQIRHSRDLVDRFLQQLTGAVVTSQLKQGTIDPRMARAFHDRLYVNWMQQLLARSERDPQRAALETMLLANKAQEQGMVVSDQAINDLIKQISVNSVTPAELRAIIASLRPGQPVSVAVLFEALRTQLLASQYSLMFNYTVQDLPPAQRFESYSRLNRRASAEVMPLAVGDFVDQVEEPTTEELAAYYNRFKNDFPNPDSPDPGFKEPPRATFQYFKASIDQVADRLKADITDEQVSQYYQDNKEQFRVFSFDDEPSPTEEQPAAEPADKSESTEESPAADAQPKTEESEPAQPEAAADKPAEKPEPADSKADAEPSSDSQPNASDAADDEKPSSDEPADSEPDESDKPSDESLSSRARATAVVRFVSTLQQQQGESAADTPSTEPADNEPPAEDASSIPADQQPAEPADESTESEPAADDKPADDKPTEEQPADQKPAEDKPAPSDQPPSDGQPADAPVQAPAEPQYEPLEKVADTIRMSLAREQAQQLIDEQFDELTGQMRRYTDEYDIYTAEQGINSNAKPPTPLDLAKLAEGKDVQALELKSVTAAEAAQTDLGRAFRVVSNPNTQFPFTVPFADFAFAETLPTFKPEVIRDNENQLYLFWKTAEEEAFVPPLDQIEGRVKLAWKMKQARELARKRAEEYAVQARSLKKPLAELFAAQSKLSITDTGPFSWLTQGNVPAQPGALPRLSEVTGVDRAGPEFMKATFDLESGGVGVALNEPQTFAYVIRVIDFEPPLDELRDDFARTNPGRYISAAADEQRAIYRAWIEDLNKQAGVVWLNEANPAGDSPPEEAGF